MPDKPRLVGGVKEHNQKDISFPGSPGLWPVSFTSSTLKGIGEYPLEIVTPSEFIDSILPEILKGLEEKK